MRTHLICFHAFAAPGRDKMDWIEDWNKALLYIEEHLGEELEYSEAAKIACCSTYHFQRMFAYMAGVPLAEYIRRRRMTLAAAELQAGEDKIIDIGLKYGYSSPTAFNRAFQGVHGIAPSAAREAKVSLKSYLPISFKIMVKGAVEMNYRIEKKEGFRIVGVSQPLHKEVEKNFEIVPGMWQQAAGDGTLQKLAGIMNGQPMGMLGVSACSENEEWQYFIAVASSSPAEENWKEYNIPAATWAIFYGEGTNESIQELEKQIVLEWLPSSGYEYGNAPDIEVYISPDPQNAKFEVWIPVVKKS